MIEERSGFKYGFILGVRDISSWGSHRDAHFAKRAGDKTRIWNTNMCGLPVLRRKKLVARMMMNRQVKQQPANYQGIFE